MNPISRLLAPLRQVAAAFFKHDVALRREHGRLEVVLQERSAKPGKRAPSREDQARRKEKQELDLVRQQLATLLDELPETRDTMRHLVFVEQAIARKGLRALHRVPLDVLQRALEQLEGLVTNWSPEGLANLRSKMAVAIIDREHMDPEAEVDSYRTAAVLDQGVTVSEHGALDEIPPEPAAPVAAAAAQPEPSEEAALAAAYAALGTLAPAAVEVQSELGSPSARAAARPPQRATGRPEEIRLRELQG